MAEDRYLRWVVRLLWIGLILAAIWAGLRWVLPWLAPFLTAGVLAWLLEPAGGWVIRVGRVPRRGGGAPCAGSFKHLTPPTDPFGWRLGGGGGL